MILLLTCVTFSCHKKITTKIINENNYINNDSIIYELPKKATEKILDCISDQEVSYCNLVCNTAKNEYSFSFPYIDKIKIGRKDSILLEKSDTYLKLNNRIIPLIHYSDNLFSNIPRDSLFYFNEFKSCIITVSATGEFIDGIKY